MPREEIRGNLGTHIHGCDLCQAVCPRNQKIIQNASRKDPFIQVLKELFDLEKLLILEEDYYQDVVYPIMHNYIRDMDIFRRNAAIALGNTGDPKYIPALEKAALSKNQQMREAALWAIDKISRQE